MNSRILTTNNSTLSKFNEIKLMKKINIYNQVYSSKAQVINNKISKVISVIDKELMVKQFVQPIVTIGDGDNDVGMAKHADIAIGFGRC